MIIWLILSTPGNYDVKVYKYTDAMACGLLANRLNSAMVAIGHSEISYSCEKD